MITVAATVEVRRGEGFPREVVNVHDPIVQQLVTSHLLRQPGVRSVSPDMHAHNVVVDLDFPVEQAPAAVDTLLSCSVTLYGTADGRIYELPVILKVW